MIGGVFAQQGFLRRDLSRYVFAKECAIRIDKQQKEHYNNVVIDNDVIYNNVVIDNDVII